MGKSPGKWFKAVLFRKRSSKSNLSKGKEITKSAIEKMTPLPNKEPVACLPVDPPLISEPLPCPTAGGKQNPDSENVDNAILPSTNSVLSSPKQDEEAQSAPYLSTTEDSQRMRHERATIKAQAAFRGYLARRAFTTLQGIIRVQAIIRGCLVRRQAVATLYSVQGIVKFQALVRGYLVRGSDIGVKVHSRLNLQNQDVNHAKPCETSRSDRAQKLLENAFVGKLLSMSPTVMPQHLQCGTEEPNSAWAWLLRWTVSHVWEPQSKANNHIGLNPRRLQTEKANVKRSGRRMQFASLENGRNHAISDSEKIKQKPRRVLDHSAGSTQGHPQNEIEKVKHSLKKVSQSTKDKSVKAEVGTGQPRRNHRKSENLAVSEHLDHSTETQSNKLRVEIEGEITKSADGETFEELPRTDGPVDDLQDHPVGFVSDKQHKDTGNDKDRDILTVNQSGNDKQLMDDQTGNGIHKINKRRASLPAKHDNLETGLPSVTKMPSYMAATESAKAKVRGQASPRSGQDGF